MLEVGDIHRFKNVGNYSSYCRCVKAQSTSNGKKKGNNNRKNGNRKHGNLSSAKQLRKITQ